jgi:hypothetical protein
MAEISHETETLLFKLYNLKSQDSTIIQDILKKKNSIGEMIEEAKASNEETERERERLERELSEFTTQKDSFFEAFGGLKDGDFQALQAIGVTVAVEPLVSSVNEKAPEYEDSLRKKIEEAKNKIVELFGKISEYGANLDTVEEEYQRAEADRQELADLVEQSLNGTESEMLNRQFIKSRLVNFDCFTEEEENELCRLIIFPEDSLAEFDRTYEERKARREEQDAHPVEEVVEEVVKPVVVSSEEDTTTSTGTTDEEDKKESETEYKIDDIVALTTEGGKPAEEGKKDDEEVVSDTTTIYGAPAEEPKDDEDDKYKTIVIDVPAEDKKEPEGEPKDEVDSDAPTTIIDLGEVKTALEEDEHRYENSEAAAEEYLSELGFQVDRFKKEELTKIYDYLKGVDSTLIKNNFELLRSINADDEAYVYANGHMFVTDPELSEKINFLRSKSISEKKIKALLTTATADSVLRKNFSTIKERIEALEKSEPVTDENIGYFENDTALFDSNLELVNKTFELDEKEVRNFKPILFSPYVAGDIKVLKEYLLSIVKQDNGRYALNTLMHSPRELVTGIDSVVESGLEDLITANPEILELDLEVLLRRVEYLKSKGIELYDDEKEAYNPDIIDYTSFASKYGIELPELKSYSEANKAIPALVGNEDFTQILVDSLNGYYETPEVDPEVVLPDEQKAKYDELIASFEEMFKASKVGNLTYKIDDVFVSRTKLERHIKLLLNTLSKQGQEIDGVEKEIILTSLMYNLREDEAKLKKVAESCLGFNKGEEVGGPTL